MKICVKYPLGCSSAILVVLVFILPAVLWGQNTSSPRKQSALSQKTAVKSPETADLPLLSGGFQIVDRRAKLVEHPNDNRWFLVFEPFTRGKPQPSAQSGVTTRPVLKPKTSPDTSLHFTHPIEVLPCKWLTAMTRVISRKDDISLTFRIWGEITVYRKRNYILPTLVATESLFGGNMQAKSIKSSGTVPAAGKDKTAGNKSGQQADLTRLAEQIRKKLLAIPRTHILDLSDKTTARPATGVTTKGASGSQTVVQKPVAVTEKASVNWKDGDIIKDRTGRLLFKSQENRYQFIFESYSKNLNEPPVLLHPNRYLELMEKMNKLYSQSARFRINGRISKYHGQYYLLLRKVLLVPNQDNLGK